MKNRTIKRAAMLIVVIASAAWTGIYTWDIVESVTGSQGIVFSASLGTIFEVGTNGLKLTSGTGGILNYDRILLPALLIPFMILVGFGIYGAWALGMPRRSSKASG